MNQDSKEIVPIEPGLPDQVELPPAQIEGDMIVTGEIHSSYIAMGRGAQVIVEQQIVIPIPPPPEPTHPPQLDQFVGRQTELTYFADKLATRHLAVISGMAGVGKTTLATALAQLWQGWQTNESSGVTASPDQGVLERLDQPPSQAKYKIFWHTFHEDEGVMGLIWQLAGFLAWHGRDELWGMLCSIRHSGGQPPPPTTFFDYALKLLQRQGYLLCLDDIHHVHDDPVLPQFIERLGELVRAGEVSLIITSREMPAYVRSIKFEPLEGFQPPDVAALIAARGLSLDQSVINQLYTQTEGNVELLILAINMLQHTNDSEQAIQNLAEADDIERYLIKEIDDHLSEVERQIMVTLAILLGYPGSREAIEAISEARQVKRSLQSLSDRHLLIIYQHEGESWYSAHTILRAFYYELPSRRERQAWHRRAGDYYEQEEQDILPAARHFELAGNYEQSARLATADVWALINRGQVRPLGRLLENLLTRQVGQETRILVHLAYGQICAFLSESQPARDSYQQALTLLEKLPVSTGGRELKARACLGMGELLRRESPQEAMLWLAEGLAELAGDELTATPQVTEAALYIRAGNVQWEEGNYATALALLQQGLQRLPEGASQWRAIALVNLGNVYDVQGEGERAIECLRQALEISHQLQDHYWTLVIWSNLGIAKLLSGDWAEAVVYCQQALELAGRLGNAAEQARIGNLLGSLHLWQGDDEAAQAFLTHSLQLVRTHNFNLELPYLLNTLADLYIRQGQGVMAESYLQEAEKVALALGIKHQLPEIYYLRAQVWLGAGQFEAALADAMRAVNLARELKLDREQGIGLGIQGRALLAAGQRELALTAFAQSSTLLAERDPYEAARTGLAWGHALLTGPERDQGQQLLETAQTTFARLGARRELALIAGQSGS